MQRIIYSSPNKIEWDAQSAFKVTNYYTDKEEHMVFCYLKQYVHGGSLKICTYCFDSEASGKTDLQLCVNLNPLEKSGCVSIEFGIDGINSVCCAESPKEVFAAEGIEYHSYKANDQQGYYWCGEVTLTAQFIQRHFGTQLCEGSVILLNLYRLFDGSEDYACLFPDTQRNTASLAASMQEFVVLNY